MIIMSKISFVEGENVIRELLGIKMYDGCLSSEPSDVLIVYTKTLRGSYK